MKTSTAARGMAWLGSLAPHLQVHLVMPYAHMRKSLAKAQRSGYLLNCHQEHINSCLSHEALCCRAENDAQMVAPATTELTRMALRRSGDSLGTQDSMHAPNQVRAEAIRQAWDLPPASQPHACDCTMPIGQMGLINIHLQSGWLVACRAVGKCSQTQYRLLSATACLGLLPELNSSPDGPEQTSSRQENQTQSDVYCMRLTDALLLQHLINSAASRASSNGRADGLPPRYAEPAAQHQHQHQQPLPAAVGYLVTRMLSLISCVYILQRPDRPYEAELEPARPAGSSGILRVLILWHCTAMTQEHATNISCHVHASSVVITLPCQYYLSRAGP